MVKNLEYSSEEVREEAIEKGFKEELSPLFDSPILIRDDAVTRSYFHISGGRGDLAVQMGVYGVNTLKALLDRSAREQWNRDYPEEWTLIRNNGPESEFVDYHVDCSGKKRFTAGKFGNGPRAYPDRIPLDFASQPCFSDEEIFKEAYGQRGFQDYEVPIAHELTEKDRVVLELRDFRWENFSNTKRKANWSKAIPATFLLGLCGGLIGTLPSVIAINYGIAPNPQLAIAGGFAGFSGGIYTGFRKTKNIEIDKKAINSSSLDETLFNEDVLEFLSI